MRFSKNLEKYWFPKWPIKRRSIKRDQDSIFRYQSPTLSNDSLFQKRLKHSDGMKTTMNHWADFCQPIDRFRSNEASAHLAFIKFSITDQFWRLVTKHCKTQDQSTISECLRWVLWGRKTCGYSTRWYTEVVLSLEPFCSLFRWGGAITVQKHANPILFAAWLHARWHVRKSGGSNRLYVTM